MLVTFLRTLTFLVLVAALLGACGGGAPSFDPTGACTGDGSAPGAYPDLEALVPAAKAAGALVIVQCDPIPLGILKPPGEFGVDVAVGEGQSLGNRLDFGGPSFGFFAAQEAYIRRMPGRIAGETTDVDGRRGFVLTLQTREQHIRREKATHNICTAQALNALAGMIYLSWLGRQGIVELGDLLVSRTAYARKALTAIDGVSDWHSQPVAEESIKPFDLGTSTTDHKLVNHLL